MTDLAGIRASVEGLNEASDSVAAAEKCLESSLKSLADKNLEIGEGKKNLPLQF